jgi:N-acetylmuramoyl-L-alanine amidase
VRTFKRCLCLGIAGGAAALLVWSVAPALSLTPYAPPAVDFEQRLPALERVPAPSGPTRASVAEDGHPEGPVRFRSPVIDAPARFDLVGIGREMRPLEYRAELDGQVWTRWVQAENGDPVYFGGADQLQVRSRGVRPSGRLHYVNVSGTDTPLNRVLTGARSAVNSALISVASTTTAVAVQSEPEIVGRRQWGATRDDGACRPRGNPSYGKVKAAAVHHTVSANEYDRDEAPRIVLGICRFHRNANGWNDVGYNFLVDRFGTIYEGRSGGVRKPVVGSHAQGFNAQTTGAASIGTHTASRASDQAVDAFARLLAWKLSIHGASTATGKTRLRSAGGSVSRYPAGRKIRAKRIFGHRRVNSTECPGDELKRQLRRIRDRAQRLIAGNGGIPG